MRRVLWLAFVGLVLGGMLASSVAWAEKVEGRDWVPRGSNDPMIDPALPLIMVQGADTAWVNVHLNPALCPGDPDRGGEATGGPGPLETWCFEQGAADTTSTGPMGGGTHTYTWTHIDRRTLRDDFDSLYWHASTFQAPTPGDMSMWCGGYNNRCFTWDRTTGGYGNFWNQIMQLDLEVIAGEDTVNTFSVTQGCTLACRLRYVLECNYDYAYLEFYSFKESVWRVIDTFNGKGGCTVFARKCLEDWNNYVTTSKCPADGFGTPMDYPKAWRGESVAPRDNPEYPYGGGGTGNDYVIVPGDSISATPEDTPVRLRWRFTTDAMWSAEEPGNEEAKGLWVDDVVVKWDTTWAAPPGHNTFVETFNFLLEGDVPGRPWSFPPGDAVHDGWAIRYDLDPPYEGYFLPGIGDSGIPTACEVNASWQWSVTPTATLLPPSVPPDQGFRMFMLSPSVPLDYVDPDGPTYEQVGVVVDYDMYMYMDSETCDFTDTKVRVHRDVAPGWDPDGAWCPWINIDGYVWFGGGTFWNIDQTEDVTPFVSQAGLDSVQFAFTIIDVGEPGDRCWEPTLPPHKDVQFVVDNVSVGLTDGSATQFTASGRSFLFQDTFNTLTCMHNANVANNDLRYGLYVLQDQSESLNITVTDPDGITPGNVFLKYSLNDTAGPWNTVILNLSEPDELDPSIGGVFCGTICPDPEWIPGTEITYYVYAVDDLLNDAYFPDGAEVGHVDYPEHYTVRILPTGGATPLAQEDDAKILLVDDFGRSRYDYHPCRSETTIKAIQDFYEEVLEDLGYGYMEPGGYDKYLVRAASSNQRINEPWGFWRADPGDPSVGEKVYDIVIWTTGPYFDTRTIQDTTQGFIQEYTFHGGKIFITGDRILQDLTNTATATWPNFVEGTLAAKTVDPGIHPSAFLDSDRYPTCSYENLSPRLRLMSPGDSCNLYSGCEILRPEMDKMTINDQDLPAWAHPGGFYIYDDIASPYDSLAAIYNVVYQEGSPDTGQVVYMAFSLEAIVDSTGLACDPPPSTAGLRGDYGYGVFQGRASIMKDVLLWFGEQISVPNVSVGPLGERYVNALQPVQPNPFNPETNVSFSLAARGRVELVVFDVLGRRVTALVDGVREAGPHMVRWDGRNEAGHPVASGLYFARMETKGFTATEKMTLLK